MAASTTGAELKIDSIATVQGQEYVNNLVMIKMKNGFVDDKHN